MTLTDYPFLHSSSELSARRAKVSLPWPASVECRPAVATAGVISQAVPLFDEAAPPGQKRYLLLANASEELPPILAVRPDDTGEANVAPSQSRVEIGVLRQGEKPYFYREDEARVHVSGREIGLRLGLDLDGEYSWWQWTRAELLWSGAVADAWRIGGHIVTYTVEKAPHIPSKLNMFEEMEQFGGRQISADVFLIAWHSGLLQVTAHFKNNHFMVPPEDVPGLPVIAVTDLRGDWRNTIINSPEHTEYSGGAGDGIDLSKCRLFFDENNGGLLRPFESGVLFRPFERIEILTHKSIENEFFYLGDQNQKGFPAGVARTVQFNISLNDQSARVAECSVPAEWYGRCGVFNGQPQQPVIGRAHAWSSITCDEIYKSTHRGGFDTGRVWRYLRRDLRSGIPEIDDTEWEGQRAQALLLDAYLRPEDNDRELILQQIYHFADTGVHHGFNAVRCHGYNINHFPMPMMRVGSLVLGHSETGDPYLLETARAVADTWMHIDETNQPRHSIGRDAYPLAGLMTLFDYTGDARYLDYGRRVVQRLFATQTASGGFSGQGNIGVIGGISNKWTERDISFASGLLCPIAIFEWALRDGRWPQDFEERMTRWYELALDLQSPQGYWPQGSREGNPPYPLIAAGLQFTFAAYHRLFGDRRGLDAMQHYFDYAETHADYLLGTHAFLAPLHASFYEMEYSACRNNKTSTEEHYALNGTAKVPA